MAGLDALRGIAAILVVLYHYTVRYQEVVAPHHNNMWWSFPYAAIGVQIFFAISGFVIFMTLERCVSIRDFAVSRLARLYPPFLFCMLFTALIIFGTGVNIRSLESADVFSNLIMAVGLVGGNYVDGSYWTLTSEISFYILISVFFYHVQRRRLHAGSGNFADPSRNPLVYFVLVWMVVTVIGRINASSMFAPLSLGLNFLYGQLFVVGIAVYGLSKAKPFVPALLLAMAAISGGFTTEGHFSLTACVKVLGIAALVGFAARIRLQNWGASIAGFLGGVSYSLYLVHQSIGYIMIAKLESAGLNANLAVWGTILLMIAIAHLIRTYIEIPAQHWLGEQYKLWKASRPVVVAADPS